MSCHSCSTRQCHSRISSCFQFTSKILGPALWLLGRTANKHHLQHTLGGRIELDSDNLREIHVCYHHDWRVSLELLVEVWNISSADTWEGQCVIQPSLVHCSRVYKAPQQMDPVPLDILVPLQKRPSSSCVNLLQTFLKGSGLRLKHQCNDKAW